MTRRAAATVVVAALVVGACGTRRDDVVAPALVTTTASVAAPAGAAEQPTPRGVEVRQVDCPAALAGDDRACGLVTVPIDRDDPAAGSTRITIVTVAGYDPGFLTPVAVLQGGPGGASSDMATWFPQQPFTQVFVDQRGTGFVGPDFNCDELDAATSRMLTSPSAEAGIVAQNAVDDCARRLDDDPVLQQTHSAAHAADVIDVMAALGYHRWVVYGVSYGSTIGLEILRNAPPGLAGAVLDALYPPELDVDAALAESSTWALEEVAASCDADAICRSYLDGEPFDEVVSRVIADLDAEPMVVPTRARDTGLDRDVDLVLDGRRLAEFVFLLMYSEQRVRFLPAVIAGIDERESSAAEWLASTGARILVSSRRANDEGTYFAVHCHDRLPFTDGPGESLDPFAAAITASSLREGCEEWDRATAGPEADDPVESSVPTLLLSAQFDPITPAAFADLVEPGLARATSVVQEGRGHGIWYGDECIARIVRSFVADPARDLDTSCADDAVPVEWARP